MILDPHVKLDQHQNLITSRGSLLAHACQVLSTPIHVFASYFVDRWTHRQIHIQYMLRQRHGGNYVCYVCLGQ